MDIHASYDCIIVGAGISGLYSARELAKSHPTWRIAIAERYKGLGGRTYSYSPPEVKGVQWEMGAGRVRDDHVLVLDLLKEYGLTWVPISDAITFKRSGVAALEANIFESVFVPTMFQPLAWLNPATLATHTIEELLMKIYGKERTDEALSEFPYRAEVNTLRADLALHAFLGGEMSSHRGYGVVKEGFSELVKRMREDVEARGVIVLNRHRLVGLESQGEATDLTFEFGYEGEGKAHGKITLRAEKCVVLALHRDAIAELAEFDGWPVLNMLKTQPLLRTYAVFPTKGGAWFADLPRVVTPERPRYILPMDASCGTIMISYTDGDDTTEYMNIQRKGGDKALEKVILKDVRALFPDRKIPDPIVFKSHGWETGCTYWLPGLYNPESVARKALHPLPQFPRVWLCGESWSLKQAWVEGALECAEEMLSAIEKKGY